MHKPLVSKRKADAISNGVFLVALGMLFYTNFWWPGILLALWALLATRQYLSQRLYDLAITSFVLLGLFVISLLKLDIQLVLPILFVVGGIYIIIREYFYADDTNGEEKSEEIQDDMNND